jgi:D-alanyl-lipoteichoic acid acyltransferase DltB (MBOAT superfamily)
VFVFLPVALLGWLALIRLRSKGPARLWLLATSSVFYGWWSVPFLALLYVMISVNYLIGEALLRMPAGRPRVAWWVLFAGLSADLGLLAWFKYSTFVAGNVAALTGIEFTMHAVVLPLGISFHTFQQIGYLVDCYRKTTRSYPFLDYALFVLFFPQLIAGPIVYHRDLTPQFREPARFQFRHTAMAEGIAFFVIGLAKKLLLADPMSALSDGVFAAPADGAPGFYAAWLGVLAFGFGLYFDFSAYSDMAIGLGRMFGMSIPYNFASPYQAVSIVDFWRRWHMTLSRFLRDYVYIPLGGNRQGPRRQHVNLMLTMLLGGLWHGAAWTFVVWGGLHGLYLLVNHAWSASRPIRPVREAPLWVRRLAGRTLTLLAVMVAWVFFRADSFADALAVLGGMAGLNGAWAGQALPAARITAYIALGGGALVALFGPSTQRMVDRVADSASPGPVPVETPRAQRAWIAGAVQQGLTWRPSTGWALALATMVIASIGLMARTREFVYFQF